jgi:N-acetylmuramoyl-L-alanine amidase
VKVLNHRLVQDDGTPIPFKASPNTGGVLSARWLVMHYTGGRSTESSVAWLLNPLSRASAHVVIGRYGGIIQLVPFNIVAWHAGISRWLNVNGLNQHSIGIELDNAGRLDQIAGKWVSPLKIMVPDDQVRIDRHRNDRPDAPPCGWQTYTPQQIESAYSVAQALIAHYGLEDIIGHDDIAPERCRDPGPDFPMEHLRTTLFGQKEDTPPVFVARAMLTVRGGPGTEHPALPGSPIRAGTRVQALEQHGLWWKVDVLDESNGVVDLVGWCHGRHLVAEN